MPRLTSSEIFAILLWLVAVLALFVYTTPRRAVLIGLVGGWLFLPDIALRVPGALPDLTKASITSFGLLACVLVFERRRILSLRPRWFDVPMLVWCGGPFLTALVNGEGVHEAISALSANTIVWGIPYLLGRLYIQDAEGWRDLALAIFWGGVAYVPLCWFEIIAGPQLALWVYGYLPKAIFSAYRFGGWRPIVFMDHGLMVALWMTAAAVSGFWLWRAGMLPRVWRVPSGVLILTLLGTTIALRSVNAWLLLPIGIGILWFSTRFRTTCLAWGSVALILLYLVVRALGLWNGQELSALTARVLPAKFNSVDFRLENEQRFVVRAQQQPILGWGRFGRMFPPEVPGVPNSTPDSMWIIAYGEQGTVGLIALFAFLLLPLIFLVRRVAVADWTRPPYAPAVALAVILILYAADNLANAMHNPVYLLAVGGLLTLPRVVAETEGETETVMANVPLPAQAQ